ncbi:MAG: leucine-rich repeat protein [Ruminococcus sp.]|nr:leucine-rich repeat protein [Ruminococcus sp.]
MKMNKIIAGVMAVCVMGFGVPYVNAVADNNTVIMASAETINSGTCGKNLTWILDDEGTLTISGTGDMEDYKNSISHDDIPWNSENKVIKKVVIEDGVTSIGANSFASCGNLTSIEIPDSVKSIREKAFSYCDFTSVKIPDGVTSIGDYAFFACRSLTSVEIADSVTSIGQTAFCDCSGLQSVKMSNSITSIEEGTFNSCGRLESINIPDSLTSIGRGAFYMCGSLKSVELPDSLTSIGEIAFSGSGLTSVKIPESVKSISNNAFYCWKLKSITIFNPDCIISDDNAISDGYNGFNGTIYGYENSTAQEYAEKHGSKFKIIGQEDVAGDMNGDNSVNVADAVLLQNVILGRQELTEEQFKNADLTGDDFVDSFDMVLLRKKIIENNK